jgi:3-oxoacyl-[acyl-carrier protein] reductase
VRNLEGRVAVVTGGTRGIGFSIAKGLAERGASVTVTGRSAAPEQAMAALGGDARFIQADSGRYEDVRAAIERAAAPSGGIDLLVSAGAEGPSGPKPFAEMTGAEIESGITGRLYPRIFPVHAAIPALRSRGGAVVMICTDAARVPTPGEAVIGAVGAAVILMTKALARELSRVRIRVNAVAITLTSDTPSWDRIFAKQDFESKLFAKALSRFPTGRAPRSDEVAEAALFLLSDSASQVTGQTLSVNGGLSFGGW